MFCLDNKPFLCFSGAAAAEGKASGKRSRVLDSDEDEEDERGAVKYFKILHTKFPHSVLLTCFTFY